MKLQSHQTSSRQGLARRLGQFDAAMIVMGGIVGSGIFMNPHVVAKQVHTPLLIMCAWVLGGLVALAGAFVYAELAARRPEVGGQYAYIREAYHPLVAFLYGWGLLLVTQTGGMAAVAVTFAQYFIELTGSPLPDWFFASLALTILTIVNCFGVRAGSSIQNLLMTLKILAIALLVVVGLSSSEATRIALSPPIDQPLSLPLLTAFGAAMVPVLFAYGGWQTSSFLAGEMRDPQRHLPRGLLIGVLGVILLYLSVNVACLGTLGASGLAQSSTPASAVMRQTWGESGRRVIAIGIAISTLGFLSQGILTAPRVYFAMAEDGLFFKGVAWIHPRTRVPIVAIAIQGILATIIAISGKYEQILNYVVSTDFIFFGLTATCLFIFRSRARDQQETFRTFRTPGHPWLTTFFILASWLVVINTIVAFPTNSLIGISILFSGIPVYFLWRRGTTS